MKAEEICLSSVNSKYIKSALMHKAPNQHVQVYIVLLCLIVLCFTDITFSYILEVCSNLVLSKFIGAIFPIALFTLCLCVIFW